MSRFPSLPERPVLSDVFKRSTDGVGLLLEYHDVLLRGPSLLPLLAHVRKLTETPSRHCSTVYAQRAASRCRY